MPPFLFPIKSKRHAPALCREHGQALQEAVGRDVRRREDAPQGPAESDASAGFCAASKGLRGQAAAHAVRHDQQADLRKR